MQKSEVRTQNSNAKANNAVHFCIMISYFRIRALLLHSSFWTSVFSLLTSAFVFVRDRGLVSRASTSAEIRNLLGRLENCLRRVSCCRSSFADHLFEFLPCPANAGDFDCAVFGNPKRSRNIGQPVSIRHREALRVV